MIISHRHRFIFLKTRKTAGTSIETYLSAHCGPDDVLTRFGVEVEGHDARNDTGFFNPIPELLQTRQHWQHVLRQCVKRRKFRNHIPGFRVRARIPRPIWDSYTKFCVERNPWDKTLSHFHMVKGKQAAQRDLDFDTYLSEGRFCRDLFIYAEPNNETQLLVDRVIRYERLAEELGEVFAQLGVPFDGSLGVRAKGGYRKDRRGYAEVYTPEQREIVARAYATEIELFGWEF